jgi:hypothetical protein
MAESSNQFIIEKLAASIRESGREIEDYFGSISLDIFFKRRSEKWSPAENLLHLIKSVSPVAKAMKMPKWILRTLYGKPKTASRDFEQIKEIYQRALAEGLKAPERFVPLIEEAQINPELFKNGLIEKWVEKAKEIAVALQGWKDEELDQYVLPHPALGKLTIREMIFFTLYHNQHHVNNVQKLLKPSK